MTIDFSRSQTIIILLFGLAALLFLLIGLIQVRRVKKYRLSLQTVEKFLNGIDPFKGLEVNLDRILEWFREEVVAPSYTFYVFDEKNNRYSVRSVFRWSDEDARVAPSYSGLVPYKTMEFHPPLNIQKGSSTEPLGLVENGELLLLNLPFGDKALIRIGPVQSISKKGLEKMRHMVHYLENSVHTILEANTYKSKTDVLELSSNAIQTISQMTYNQTSMVETIFFSVIQAFNLSSGLFMTMGEGTTRTICAQGISSSLLNQFEQELKTTSMNEQLIKGPTFKVIERSNPLFKKLPPSIQERTKTMVVLQRIRLQREIGFLMAFFDEPALSDSEIYESMESFKLIGQKLETVLKFQSQTDFLSNASIEKLKLMAQMVDYLQPYTIGYSDMMSRYSIILAKELGLPEIEVVNIGLAAYLSNIGVLGLSNHLIHKEGVYSETEFEQMKSHSEVGASIILNLIGNEEVANDIRYHHERMDGNGYPEGIRGEAIPIGARIIAVVQTFLAKINGRAYRSPLPFDKALDVLRSASGSQLDEEVVEAFITWFNKKRQDPAIKDRSLGKCWEMCCVPSSICTTCPAYGQHDKNCWEFSSNNCKAHGRECETCYVFTEFKGRHSLVSNM